MRRVPMGAEQAWRRAYLRAGCQCQQRRIVTRALCSVGWIGVSAQSPDPVRGRASPQVINSSELGTADISQRSQLWRV